MGAGGIPSRGEGIRFERRLNATDKPRAQRRISQKYVVALAAYTSSINPFARLVLS